MEVTEKKVNTFVLPKETITVKFIPKRKGMASNVDDNHILSGGMLNKAIKKYVAPLSRQGGIVNVLTNQEKEYLERATGRDLSVYGDFWETFTVALRKEDANNTFYLGEPEGYLAYALLRTLKDDIAPSWKERNNKSTYDFVIVRDGEVTNENKTKLDIKKNAFKAYGKIEDDRDKLIAVLKLHSNKPISKDSKIDWLQGKVEEFVDSNPSSFLDIVQDKDFDIKMIITNAVEAGIILRDGNKYSTIDGLDLAENGEINSYNNAVKYLSNPKHQEVLHLIQARLDK